MRHFFQFGLAISLFMQLSLIPSSAAAVGSLKVGAARIDITPDANSIPRPYTSILDHIYARAV